MRFIRNAGYFSRSIMWAAIAPHARRSGTFFVGFAPVFLATVNPLGKESSTVFVERSSPLLWGA
jgi:hypothetical protein